MFDFKRNGLNFKDNLIKDFIKLMRSYPYNILDSISFDELIKDYSFSSNSFWDNYILNLDDSVDLDCFSYKNTLYLNTAKIFKINDEYYIEKLRNNICSDEKIINKNIEKVRSNLISKGIKVNDDPQNLFIIEESNKIKIKFRKFKYID